MVEDCKQLVERYLRELEGAFQVHDTESGCVIVTPFMRRDNDLIEIGVERMPDGRHLLTDYGETLAFLNLSGVNVSRSLDAKRVVAQTAKRFGVEIAEDDISVHANQNELGSALKGIIDAINDIGHLVYNRQRRPPLSFDDKIEKVLISSGLPYEPNFPVQGKTELHRFRFYVNGRYRALVEPLSASSAASAHAKAQRLAFRWVDIGELDGEFRKLAVIDDEGVRNTLWRGCPLEVLSGYADGVVLWSQIDQLPSHVLQERLM